MKRYIDMPICATEWEIESATPKKCLSKAYKVGGQKLIQFAEAVVLSLNEWQDNGLPKVLQNVNFEVNYTTADYGDLYFHVDHNREFEYNGFDLSDIGTQYQAYKGKLSVCLTTFGYSGLTLAEFLDGYSTDLAQEFIEAHFYELGQLCTIEELLIVMSKNAEFSHLDSDNAKNIALLIMSGEEVNIKLAFEITKSLCSEEV